MGAWTFYLLNDSESAGFVLSHHAKGFRKGPGLAANNPLIGRGLLTAEGELWTQERQQLAPVFRPRNISAMRPWLESAVQEVLDPTLAKSPQDLEAAMLELSLYLVLKSVFATSDLSLASVRAMGEDVRWLMHYFYHRSRTVWRFPYVFPFNRRYHRHAQHLIQRVEDITFDKRPFMTLHGHLPEDPETRRQALVTLLIAGYETTGHAMSWALYLAATHPPVEERLVAESLSETTPTPSTHPWTYAAILESLRLYPPVWLLSRTPTTAVTFSNVTFRPGDILLISPWLMHRSADHYPEPEAFRPERWLNWRPPAPYAFIPFGGGPRRCIGEDLALTEALIVVSRIVARYRLTALGAPRPSVFPGLTLQSQDGLWVTIQPRSA